MNYRKLIIFLNIFICCWILKCCASKGKSRRIPIQHLADGTSYAPLEREILNILGFPEEPKNPEKAPIRKRSAPNYMLSIYKHDKEPKSMKQLPTPDQFDISEINRQVMNDSDVIISFMAEQPHKGEGGKPDHVRRMWFNLSELTKDDVLQYAELRLYRIIEGLRKKFRGAYKIVVDRVFYGSNGERNFERIDSVDTPAGFEGWITLNVTRAMNYWTEHPNDNRGIRVLTYSINQKGKRVKAEFIGIVGFNGEEEKQPFVTGFFKNKYSNEVQMQLTDVLQTHRRKRSTDELETLIQEQINQSVSSHTGKECKRQKFYLNFKDISWHEWIIAPEGYDSYVCEGTCTFPTTSTVNATNHAIAQLLYYNVRPDEIPKPCCVATKLSSISILYFATDNSVVYKKYKDMAVEECGCH